MKEFDKNYDFKTVENKWQKFWQTQNIYKWNSSEPRKNNFVIDTPPPTVSGALHIGHVFSYTQADFIARFQRMKGKNVFYPMGFDDNGLPTERLVEKQKSIKASDIERAEFIKLCQEVVVEAENEFRALFNNLALSVDWTQEYQTISANSRKLSQMSFLDLVSKKQVYRSEQPMLWDPLDRTALAQTDIEDKEQQSVMNEIKFITEEGKEIFIATTRPELLSACVAVLFNPKDERYKSLNDKYAITPLFKVKVPFIADEMVDIEKGTGLVMCCTFGDTTDLAWWKKYKLPLRIVIGKNGRMLRIDLREISQDITLANKYLDLIFDLKIKEARAKIIECLDNLGLLVAQTPITHNVKCAERSGGPLEILTTSQWFIKTLDHKQGLFEKSAELNWYPQSMKIRLDSWIENLSWDWCISRQRFFGVPFPIWYSKRAGEEDKILYADMDQLPVDPLSDLPKGYDRSEVEPDLDVMDTWATSSISPQLNSFGISNDLIIDKDRHEKLFPADLRPQAHEIIRTWAFTTILKSYLHENKLPWKNIMVSGWCLAQDKTKMSKSKGNGVTPEELLTNFGSDIVRYWASTAKLGADTIYSEDVVKNGKRLINKLWNAAKLISINLKDLNIENKISLNQLINNSKIFYEIDLWLLSKLHQVIKKVTEELNKFEYCNARNILEEFFWKNLCDNYLEIVKVRAYNQENNDDAGQLSALYTMYYSLEILLKLFAPFIPHICEEIYQNIYTNNISINARGVWPSIEEVPGDNSYIKNVDQLIDILDIVRKAKAEKNLSIKAPINILEVKASAFENEQTLQDLKNVTNAKAISFVKEFKSLKQVVVIDDLEVNIEFEM